jgi:hypothetical protein
MLPPGSLPLPERRWCEWEAPPSGIDPLERTIAVDPIAQIGPLGLKME